MAVLSGIVPVYGVDQYLRECLDSILGQTGSGLSVEVVAVDDCSPDGSAAILAEYAARQPRLRVVTHPANLGLGAARNTGLDHATGDYVWFVDSDDWLTPDALPAVLDRLARTAPDVLVVGYERCYLGGRINPERLVPPGPPLPETFTARDQPRILRTLHIACNKVVRREYLLATGVRFAPGWYEDVSFSNPLLLSAERIGVLEHVCYAYRQRPEGAITGTRTERHTEVFDQWHRVMAYAENGHHDLRPLMFQRMIWHYLGVLNHPSRVHRHQRRPFFRLIVRDYRRYRPAEGYPSPGGVGRITFALVALNAFIPFEALRTVYRTRRWLGSAWRWGGRALRRGYYQVQRRQPLRDEAAVYAGASHRGYAGSPHARTVASLWDEAHGLTEGRPEILVVDDPRLAAGQVALTTGTAPALRAFARARLLVSDGDLPAGVVPRQSQRLIRLGTGPVDDAGRAAGSGRAADGPPATTTGRPADTVPEARSADTPDHSATVG